MSPLLQVAVVVAAVAVVFCVLLLHQDMQRCIHIANWELVGQKLS